MPKPMKFRNARILDPANETDSIGDLVVINGKIQAPGITPLPPDTMEIDASGLALMPGLIDLHVHFREPGGEEAETWQSGSECAAYGGFTTVVTMPNTTPATDTPEKIIRQLSATENAETRILPSACITKERAGREVANLAELKTAGAIAFTDDGSIIDDEDVMRSAMQRAAKLNMPVMDHAVVTAIAGKGVIRESDLSRRLNIPSMPAAAEVEAVRRDIRLAEETGCHIHLQHLSCAESVTLIREAHAKGIRVSAETTPHHISLSVDDIPGDNANYKMNPPLGTPEDVTALIQGLADGTICCLATDHAPHTPDKKARGLLKAPFGIIGLETAAAVSYSALVTTGKLSLMQWLRSWTTAPASILNLTPPSLDVGNRADLALIDLSRSWCISESDIRSKSCNCPFIKRTVNAKPVMTIYNGRITHNLLQ